jgi:hypothetical protein
LPVEVEVDVSPGALPKTLLVGLPEQAVKESTHRIEWAMVNSGFVRPQDRVAFKLPTNSNARFRNNPKSSNDGFFLQQLNDRRHHMKNVRPALMCHPQHDHARMIRGRVCAYISEVQIERNQNSVFILAVFGNCLVRRATQSFVKHRMNVVRGAGE